MDEHAKTVLGDHADGVVGDGGGADTAVSGGVNGAGNGLDAVALAEHARGDGLVGNLTQIDEHAVDRSVDDAFAGGEACCGRNGRLARRGEGGLKRIEQTHSCLQRIKRAYGTRVMKPETFRMCFPARSALLFYAVKR